MNTVAVNHTARVINGTLVEEAGSAKSRCDPTVGTINEKRPAKKICRVCGDKAFSYNFNVITCESCKAFFRRNANKAKEIRCPFNNTCDITTLSRRFCQRCRLQKCFDVGMKKEWIMTDKARMEKRQRIQENRERRQTIGEKPDTTSEEVASTSADNVADPVEEPKQISDDEMQTDVHSAFTFPNCGGQSITTTAVLTASPSNYDLPSLRAAETFSPLFNETSFRPPPEPITTNSLISSPLQSNPFFIPPPPHIDVAVQQVQLTAQIQQAAQIEQYLQQHAATQILQALPQIPICQIAGPSTSIGESITLSKETFVKLLEQARVQHVSPLPPGHENMDVPAKCSCICTCGRYPKNRYIVDEVMKEILGASGPSSTASSPRATQTDKLPLESKKENRTFISPFNLANTAYGLKSNQTSQAKRSPTGFLQNLRNTRRRNKGSLLEEEMESVRVDPDCCLPTSTDQDRVSEVLSANGVWTELEPNSYDKILHERGCHTVIDIINLADGAIRRMIKMTKRLATFQKIEHYDQIHLLKGSCLEYVLLRSVICYNPTKRLWRSPDIATGHLIPIDPLEAAPDNLYDQLVRFYSLFKLEYVANKCVMLLMGMLVIFNPDHPNLKNRTAVEEQQSQYKRVLKRVLFSLCDQDQMKTNEDLTVLLANIIELRVLSQKVLRLIKAIDPQLLEPLLIEMFFR